VAEVDAVEPRDEYDTLVTYDLTRFGFNDMMDCRRRMRELFAQEFETMEDAGERAVDFFHDELVDEEGRPACALVRFFKTHLYRDLPDEDRASARESLPGADEIPHLRCLTLIATRGDEPAWNSRQLSRRHRAIPLSSVEVAQQSPMISQLITELGLPIAEIVRPSESLNLQLADASYNIFFVPRALGSKYIADQERFVIPYGIQSVLGFGGLLASDEVFALLLFSKVAIPPEAADQFRVLGLNMKLAIVHLTRKPLFRTVET
jgi:hypothetical protein